MFIKSLSILTLFVCGTCYSQDKNDTLLEQTVYGSPTFWNLQKEQCEFFANSYSNGQVMIEFKYGNTNTPVSYTTYFYNGDKAQFNKLNNLMVLFDTIPLSPGEFLNQSNDTFTVHQQLIADTESISYYSNGQIRQYSTQSEMSEISHGFSEIGELIYSKVIIEGDTTTGLFFTSNLIRNSFDKHPDSYYILEYFQNGELTNYIEVTLDHTITRVLNSKREIIMEDETIEFFNERIKFLLNY